MKELLQGITIFALTLFTLGSHTGHAQNLLENAGLETTDYTGWTVESDGGDGAIFGAIGYDDTQAIRTSYNWTKISQEIDLVAAGYAAEWLDQGPIIRFADWIKGASSNFEDEYRFTIELRAADGTVIDSYTSSTINCLADGSWLQVKHNLKDYAAGVRKIYIAREGRDAEFWAGNYGAIMDAAYLSIGNIFLNADSKTQDLSGWTIDVDGGDGWRARDNGQYQSSYSNCEKSQVVDLLELGYTAAELDREPIINIAEEYTGFDNGSSTADIYWLKVQFLDENDGVLLDYDSGEITCADFTQTLSEEFSFYGPGLRKIKLTHGGYGVNFWAGHYGSEISNTTGMLRMRPANDDACDAIAVATDGTPSEGHSNTNATSPTAEADLAPPAGTVGSYGCEGQDGWCSDELTVTHAIWFSFVAPATGDVVITTCGYGFDSQIALFSGADCTDYSGLALVAANDDDPDCTDFESTITAEDLTPGQTYYILIDGYDGDISDNIGIVITEFDNTPSGIKDVQAQNNELSIFPNPVSQGKNFNAMLSNEFRGTMQVQVFDLVGKKIFEQAVEKQADELTVQIPTQGLSSGHYMVRMLGSDLSATQKFVVK